MQISDNDVGSNVAVIGGSKTQTFGMGNSAHAFRTLSDTLYSDKILAVVREITCNAYDAHIAAGKPLEPIDVELTDSAFSVTDRGPGIPDRRMRDVYATYFGSTKTNDDSQTGGFGLGSKSPFAYTEHFVVKSTHAGFRTIYAAHIADESSDGAPALRTIARTQAEGSGIVVEVPIRKEDYSTFVQRVREMASLNGIPLKLNGSAQDVADYADLKEHGWGVRCRSNSMDHAKINVLFGNVLYSVPVETMREHCKDDWKNLRVQMQDDFDFFFYAPPSSVIPTPSRESLSMSPKTVATLQTIVKRANRELAALGKTVFRETLYEHMKRIEPDAYGYRFRAIDYGNGLRDQRYDIYAGAYNALVLQACRVIEKGNAPINEIARAHKKLRRKPMTVQTKWGGDFRTHDGDYRFSQVLKALRSIETKGRLRYVAHTEGRAQDLQSFFRRNAAYIDGKDRYGNFRRLTRDHIIQKEYPRIWLLESANASYKTFGAGLALIRKELKAPEIAALRAACKHYGVSLIEVAAPPSLKRLEIAQPGTARFVGPMPQTAPWRPFIGHRKAEHTLWHAEHYIAVGTASELWDSYRLSEHHDLINKTFPNTALVIGIRERKKAVASGLKNVHDIVRDRLKALRQAKTREVKIANWIATSFAHQHRYTWEDRFGNLARVDLPFFLELAGLGDKQLPGLEKMIKLMVIAHALSLRTGEDIELGRAGRPFTDRRAGELHKVHELVDVTNNIAWMKKVVPLALEHVQTTKEKDEDDE